MGRFTDAVETKLAAKKEHRACQFSKFMASLTKTEQAEVGKLLGRGEVPHKVLAEVFGLSVDMISRHRRHECEYCYGPH